MDKMQVKSPDGKDPTYCKGKKKKTKRAKKTKQIELIKNVKLNLSFKKLYYLNVFIYLD